MKLSLLIFTWLSFLQVAAGQHQDVEPLEVRIAKARENVDLAQTKFDTAKNLFESNSISKRGYRKAQYALDKSTLEWAILTDPNSTQENSLLLAKVTLQYSTANREMFERLRETGAASEYEVERAVFQEDIARLWVKYHQSQNDIRTMNFLVFKISVIKAKYAKAEYERMEPLYKRGSFSQARIERLAARVEATKAAVEQARDAMKATAKVIEK